jgi:DNA-binding Lrp family transcriptional regulator
LGLKDVELKLISELIKNSRRSDRELAKAIGISQPTVSRIRVRLEKEGLIEYTAVPNLAKLGFEIIAIILAKRDYQKHPEYGIQKAKEFAKKNPNIIFASIGNGLGYDRVAISIHKNYAEYSKFMQESKVCWGDFMSFDSFLIGLKSKDVVQPLSLKPFADHLTKKEELK